jgi:type IV/VI secretion system ImpK/VasF family protein
MSRWRLSRDTTEAFEEFQAFHSGLIELRRRAELGSLVEGEEEIARPMGARDIFVEIHGHLTELGYGRRSEVNGNRLSEVDRGYVLASFADEMFLHMTEWDGRAVWSTMLVESALYGSRIAGERVFDAADQILARQDVAKRDLAMAILMALLLGFRGRYRRHGDAHRVAAYRDQLFEFIFQRPKPTSIDWRAYLGQPYDHTLGIGSRRTVPSTRPWIAAIIGVVVLFLILSHAQWLITSDNISNRTQGVITAHETAHVQTSQ